MSSRLAQVAGTHAEGTLQIAESALNELLGRSTQPGGRQPTVEMLANNAVMVRYGLLHARAEFPPGIIPGDSPTVTLHLASLLVALALKALIHEPYIEIHGRFLTIHFARVPALRPWRNLWKHLSRLTFATAPGALRCGFRVAVHDAVAVDAPHMGERRMRDWIQTQAAAGFPAFAGSEITGTLALKQELLTELIGRWLADTAQRPERVQPPVDFGKSVALLKSAVVRAEPGTVLVDFRIAI